MMAEQIILEYYNQEGTLVVENHSVRSYTEELQYARYCEDVLDPRD